jgi:hypothetical protein
MWPLLRGLAIQLAESRRVYQPLQPAEIEGAVSARKESVWSRCLSIIKTVMPPLFSFIREAKGPAVFFLAQHIEGRPQPRDYTYLIRHVLITRFKPVRRSDLVSVAHPHVFAEVTFDVYSPHNLPRP